MIVKRMWLHGLRNTLCLYTIHCIIYKCKLRLKHAREKATTTSRNTLSSTEIDWQKENCAEVSHFILFLEFIDVVSSRLHLFLSPNFFWNQGCTFGSKTVINAVERTKPSSHILRYVYDVPCWACLMHQRGADWVTDFMRSGCFCFFVDTV